MPSGVYEKSAEWKRKASERMKGTKLHLGHKHSAEAKEKMSKAKKGKSNWSMGTKLSEEHKEKLRQAKLKNPTKYWLGKKRPKTEEWRKKISLANKGKKHSIESRFKMSKNVPRGENHHWWKGGIANKNEVERRTLEYKLWREAVFARDNWTCQNPKCNQVGGTLNAHHVKSFSKHKELRTSIENGITYCEKCHKQLKNIK